jgi:hypothetical protein
MFSQVLNAIIQLNVDLVVGLLVLRIKVTWYMHSSMYSSNNFVQICHVHEIRIENLVTGSRRTTALSFHYRTKMATMQNLEVQRTLPSFIQGK